MVDEAVASASISPCSGKNFSLSLSGVQSKWSSTKMVLK